MKKFYVNYTFLIAKLFPNIANCHIFEALLPSLIHQMLLLLMIDLFKTASRDLYTDLPPSYD